MAREDTRSMGVVDVSLRVDRSDESLLRLWKATSKGGFSCKYLSTERLNYRSWRLVNRRVLGGADKGEADSKMSLDDLARDSLSEFRPKSSQFLSNNRSHLSNNSSTLFSHSSRLSLDEQKIKKNSMNCNNSSDDTSDISEDDEYDDVNSSDDCQDAEINGQSKLASKQPDIDQKLKGLALKKTTNGNPYPAPETERGKAFKDSDKRQLPIDNNSHSKEALDINTNFKKTDSLTVPSINSSNNNQRSQSNKNIFYIANSPSPPQDSHDSVGKGTHKSETGDSTTDLVDQHPNGEIKRADSLFSSVHLQSKQWTSEGYEEDSDEGYSSTDISEDDEDEGEAVDNDVRNRINGDASIHTSNTKMERSGDSGRPEDNDSEWQSISEDDERNEPMLKPLKFSKQNDISLNHVSGSADTVLQSRSDGQSHHSLTKPRSLLSGLFLNEMADAQSSIPSVSKPVLKRSSTTGVITVNQEQPIVRGNSVKRPSILFSKRHASLTDISKNYPHHHNQLMMDFFLNDSNPKVEEGNHDGLWKQSSSVGLTDFNVTTKSSSSFVDSHSLKPEIEGRALGSRTMGSLSNHSFKNLLSKSSLSLTTLLNTSKAKFTRRNDSSEKLESLRKSLSSVSSINLKASEANGVESNSPNFSSSYSAMSATSFIPSSKMPAESAPKSIRLSPKTTRRAMLSSELSQSLKESILIDYRLGKVPLPDKVINSDELTKSIDGKGSEFDDSNDYHSKGW